MSSGFIMSCNFCHVKQYIKNKEHNICRRALCINDTAVHLNNIIKEKNARNGYSDGLIYKHAYVTIIMFYAPADNDSRAINAQEFLPNPSVANAFAR